MALTAEPPSVSLSRILILRPREHAQDSLLPVLDEAPLQMFAKQHEVRHSVDCRLPPRRRPFDLCLCGMRMLPGPAWQDYEKHSKDWRTTMKDRIRSRIMAAARSRDEENIDLGASLEKNYKPWLENNVALKKNLCRSRLTVVREALVSTREMTSFPPFSRFPLTRDVVAAMALQAEQYMYRHLNTLQDTAKEPECGESSQAIHAVRLCSP